MKAYLVGGHVRDIVLAQQKTESSQQNRSANCELPYTTGRTLDRDYVVTGASIQEMLDANFQQVGAAFPVFLHPDTKDEYALARREIKSGDKHTDFIFDFSPDISLAEDAQRRDFTINALYMDPDSSEILDPTNQGLRDCTDGILRHAGNGFDEDPLRILRSARFAAQLGFNVAGETVELILSMVESGMLRHLSRERIDNEFTRAMSPGYDSVIFLRYLHQWGVLTQLYPEIQALAHVKENPSFHWEETVFEHVLAALDVVRDNCPRVKTAVVYHDIYKPLSYQKKKELQRHVSHDDEDALDYLRTYLSQRKFNNQTKQLCKLAVKHHMRMWMIFSGMKAKKWTAMIASITHGFRTDYLQQLKDLLEVCKADDLSDKTPTCYLGSGGKNRWMTLRDCALQTFEVCHKIHARNIEGYAEMDTARLINELSRLRTKAVLSQVDFFKKAEVD